MNSVRAGLLFLVCCGEEGASESWGAVPSSSRLTAPDSDPLPVAKVAESGAWGLKGGRLFLGQRAQWRSCTPMLVRALLVSPASLL